MAGAGTDAPASPIAPGGADRGHRAHPRGTAATFLLARRDLRGRRNAGPGTHRQRMVAPSSTRADARLLSHRGRGRPPLLAVPRRTLRARDRIGALVRAWAVCVSLHE